MDALLISPLLLGTLISIVQWTRRADASTCGAQGCGEARAEQTFRPHHRSDHAMPRGVEAKKRAAINACLSAADEYREDQPDLVEALAVRVTAWAREPGAAIDRAWAVYFWLGRLRAAVGEPLFFDPEAAVLASIAERGPVDRTSADAF